MNEDIIAKAVEEVIREVLDQKKCMTLELAKRLIAKVEEKAKSLELAVVIAVSDASARPVAVHCMDGSYIGSYDVAVNKTFTSVGFKMSTEELGKLSQPGESLYGIQFTNQSKIVIFGGGGALMVGDTMIGALGVSGGSAKQDTELAAYGKTILKEVISCL